MEKKHYLIEGRVSEVWNELLQEKTELREERNEAIQELAKQILLEEVLQRNGNEDLADAKQKMEDINMRAYEIKELMEYIKAGDYTQLETLFNDFMEKYDQEFVFADEF